MNYSSEKMKCYIFTGPNGSGKTTFANEFLPVEAECLNFINADLIAQGLSPFQPDDVKIKAARLMIQEIEECIRRKESFAFETTLSGRGYIKKIKDWKNLGYEIMIYFLKLDSIDLAVKRVKLRVARGGHSIPRNVITRRYKRSWMNFQKIYKSLVDSWIVFNTSGEQPVIIDRSEDNDEK